MDQRSIEEVLSRIEEVLAKAREALMKFTPGSIEATFKPQGKGPVTEADRTANRVLQEGLLRKDEGWLSEESADDPSRLGRERVWVVDPLDGTLEFVSGVPEWCVSIGFVEKGRAVAGGICNPMTNEIFLGSIETGLSYNGRPARVRQRDTLTGGVVLASRSEVKRGEWERFRDAPFTVRPTGSIAYKLAQVAAGFADATWTVNPKNEWDIAAGVALVEAGGGFTSDSAGAPITLNNKRTLLPGLIAGSRQLKEELNRVLIGSSLNTHAGFPAEP